SETVTVSAPYVEGVFIECYVHHLYVTVTMYEEEIPYVVDEVHSIMYLAEGVGPVMMIEVDDDYPLEEQIMSVVNWSFMAVGANK
ncbi:MAG: hypothetical protein KOO63_07515, partial [Bacteroidales bacterium]|nr:hypothetical protein [Candidatus Latescibacterota bacterium]